MASTTKKYRLLKRDPRILSVTPQAKTIVRHMADAGSITQREALVDYSVQSLTRRITELRDAGFSIVGTWKHHPVTNQRYMRYSLVG